MMSFQYRSDRFSHQILGPGQTDRGRLRCPFGGGPTVRARSLQNKRDRFTATAARAATSWRTLPLLLLRQR